MKRQAVFHVDFEIWEQIIKEFGIAKCVIPHRSEDGIQTAVKGWYG